MPRNASGVYTLPSAAFTAGTSIASAAVNSNFSDLGTEITASLPVNGSKAMTGALDLFSGSVGAPSLYFGTSLTTGFYQISANKIGWAGTGVNGGSFNADGSLTVNTLSVSSFSLGTSALQYFCGRLDVATYGASVTPTYIPYNGNLFFINGSNYVIPPAGVALSTSGLAASTFYYVYAYINAGSIALEAVTTAYADSAIYGHKIKTGDGTRSLVGAVLTTAGTLFSMTHGFLGVLSYYNKKQRTSNLGITVNRTPANNAEVNIEVRTTFIQWANDETIARTRGIILIPASISAAFGCYLGVDSATAAYVGQLYHNNNNATTPTHSVEQLTYIPINSLTENVSHFATAVNTGGATASYQFQAGNQTVTVVVMG